MAIDPICGMTVDPARAAGRYDYKDTTYYFCSGSCLERFRADPDAALKRKPLILMTAPAAPSPTTPSPAAPSVRKPLPMMQAPKGEAPKGEIDPVCGMTVQPERAAGSHVYQG
ncbi:MAG: YHS domain-containing protein, partial [Nitrospira sp.]|nr:YHS domain-containing protein [Nitrospira sp.]